MAEYLVTCVIKPNRQSTHEHITYLGGPGSGGWTLMTQQVINLIENNDDHFYTQDVQRPTSCATSYPQAGEMRKKVDKRGEAL
jgi:hypothetical protein